MLAQAIDTFSTLVITDTRYLQYWYHQAPPLPTPRASPLQRQVIFQILPLQSVLRHPHTRRPYYPLAQLYHLQRLEHHHHYL